MPPPDTQDMWDLQRASPPPVDWEPDSEQRDSEWEYVGIVNEEIDALFNKRFDLPALFHTQTAFLTYQNPATRYVCSI